MGYFRALSAKQEYSERVLDVTLRVIRLNPAHYTVWCVPSCVAGPDTRKTDLSAWTVLDSFRQYRFKTLIELAKSLPDELELMNQLAEENMKSYQVWYVLLVPSASSYPLTLTRTVFLT